jgi:hypothetical protein
LESKFRAYLAENGAEPAPESAPVETDDDLFCIDQLQDDESMQQRADHVDESVVNEYIQQANHSLDERGDPWPFPPIVVFRDEAGKFWLADGWHRVETARRLDIDEIPAEVCIGSRRDALLHAVGANASHGLARSHRDKERAVRTMLEDPEWYGWSNREIARQCRVSHTFVADVRKFFDACEQIDKSGLLESGSSEIDTTLKRPDGSIDVDQLAEEVKKPLPTTRKTKNGRTMKVGGISKSNKARAPKPVSPDKQVHDALQRFSGACSDLQTIAAHLTEDDIYQIAQRHRDDLIWCLNRIPDKDAEAIRQKIMEAGNE